MYELEGKIEPSVQIKAEIVGTGPRGLTGPEGPQGPPGPAGQDALPYDDTPLREKVDELKADLVDVKVIRFNTITGKAINPENGSERDNSTYNSTDFVPVVEGMNIEINHATCWGGYGTCAYNKYKEFIKRIDDTDNMSSDTFINYTVENGVHYIRSCYYVKNPKPIEINIKKISDYLITIGNKSISNDTSLLSDRMDIDYEIDLTQYKKFGHVISSNYKSWYDGNEIYNSIVIPQSDLNVSLNIDNDTNSVNDLIYAFLRSNVLKDNNDMSVLCHNTKFHVLKPGESKNGIRIPNDCKFLYLRIFKGDIPNFKVENNPIKHEIIDMCNSSKFAYISDCKQVLMSAKHFSTGHDENFTSNNVGDNTLLIAHISDVHNDASTYSKFISFINENTDLIDCGIVSGDLVDDGRKTCFDEMNLCENELSENACLLKCVGNHERASTYTLEEMYSIGNYTSDNGKLYYYKDYSDQKIRIIILNQYDTNVMTEPSIYATGHYSQEQIDWFIDSLKSAYSLGYAVIVVYHSCNEIGFPQFNNSGFCQDVSYKISNSIVSDSIIADIIDAFQNGSTLSKNYTFSDNENTVMINTSFDGEGTFVCYLCGHEHVDFIGYSVKYPNQLICMVQGSVINSSARSESVANWKSRYDTPRIIGTSTQNSINVYGIDTNNRLLKVVKIGSTLTDKFEPRSFALFPF